MMHLVKPHCKVKGWRSEKGSEGEKLRFSVGLVDKWDFSAIKGWEDLSPKLPIFHGRMDVTVWVWVCLHTIPFQFFFEFTSDKHYHFSL